MTDDWSHDMDRRLEQMRTNPEGYIAAARAAERRPLLRRRYAVVADYHDGPKILQRFWTHRAAQRAVIDWHLRLAIINRPWGVNTRITEDS